MSRRNMIVGLAALLTAVGVWMALFGLPGSRLDYAAFAHHYDFTGDDVDDFHVEIDKIIDDDTFCNPVDNSDVVAVDPDTEYGVAVCATDFPAQTDESVGSDYGVGVLAFQVLYDKDLNSCTEDPNPDAKYVDANPDANAGATVWPAVATGDNLGGGFDCTGFGQAYPSCDVNVDGDPANLGRAYLGCGSTSGAYDLGDDEADFVLGVVYFKAIDAGIDSLSLANVSVSDPVPGEVGSCNPGLTFPVPCSGWDGFNDGDQVASPMDPALDVKDYPPDIEVTKDCDDQVLVDADITCDIHVENIGEGPGYTVGLLDGEYGTTSLDFLSYTITPDPTGCTFVTGVGGFLSCPLGNMDPDDAFDITIDMTAAGPAESHNVNAVQVSVGAGLEDADESNNTDSAVIHEFLPDINVTKLDMSTGLPGSPANGWTIGVYDGVCPPTGTPVTGVTAGAGVAAFDNLDVGTYCVQETLIDPLKWMRVSCTDGVTAEATLYQQIAITGAAKDFPLTFCNKAKDVKMEKDPDIANLWLCQDAHPGVDDCNEANAEGAIVIDEKVSNVSGDPEGVGAFEFQVKFDHKIFDIVVSATNWLNHYEMLSDGIDNDADTVIDEWDEYRTVNCTMTIISENDIRFGCVSKDVSWGDGHIPLGQDANGIAATLAVTPEPDLRLRLTPGQENGVVRTILDENCELADIYGDPLMTASTDQDNDGKLDEDPINGVDDDADTKIDEDWVDQGLLPGIVTGGLVAVCSDTTLTVRILEGDLNTDCEVDVIDDQMIAFRYGAFFGNLLYDPWFDLEPALKDFDVDIKDLQKVFGRNGSTCAAPIPDQDPLGPPP